MLPTDLLRGAGDEPATVSGACEATFLDFDNTYARLPPDFYARVNPTPVAEPKLIKFNAPLAAELRMHGAPSARALADAFSGNCLLSGSEPIAMAYAGHQFGGFVPQLGDGRAILLGEVVDRAGVRRDIQLKGSGRTPFSRGGDGRAAIGPVLREYLVSEAMHALGIPATRALAAVSTGESVLREQPLPGAIVTRVAASHIRVGTFQYFAAQGDAEAVRRLADVVIARHYPQLDGAQAPYLELLRAVGGRHAALVANWMRVGFIHGVMNTDNMTVSGETIDFGPCAFMDAYDPDTVFSSIDRGGRYAYSNQPRAAQWNLARLAETLLPLIDSDTRRAIELAGAVVSEFDTEFRVNWLRSLRAKMGLSEEEEGDETLARALLDLMQRHQADYTLTWRRLSDLADAPASSRIAAEASHPPSEVAQRGPPHHELTPLPADFFSLPEVADWLSRWRARCGHDLASPVERAAAMRRLNPAVIPRNHLVETIISAAIQGDYAPFETLLRALASPYEEIAGFSAYRSAPLAHERVLKTFCGT